MPVLLLAQGDKEARDLLRQAIEARYALQPPAIERLRVHCKRQEKAQIGPLTFGVAADVRIYFHFPKAIRWDVTARKFGLTLRQSTDAFDGTTYQQVRGSQINRITDANPIQSMRQQLWAIMAVLLTPLNEHFVSVTMADEPNSFDATNTETNDVVRLRLLANHALESVSVTCLNLEIGKEQVYTIRVSSELSNVDGLLLPRKISMLWDDRLTCEVEPVAAENNAPITDGIFSLDENPPG